MSEQQLPTLPEGFTLYESYEKAGISENDIVRVIDKWGNYTADQGREAKIFGMMWHNGDIVGYKILKRANEPKQDQSTDANLSQANNAIENNVLNDVDDINVADSQATENVYQAENSDQLDEVLDIPPPQYDPKDVAFQQVGVKHDDNKPRFDLIPPQAELELARVLEYGARKYAPNNWKHVPDAKARYIAATMRHLNAYRTGEVSDPETGLHHLAHAMASLSFIVELELTENTPSRTRTDKP